MRVIDPGTKRWLYGITFRPGRGWVVEDGDFFRVPGHAIATATHRAARTRRNKRRRKNHGVRRADKALRGATSATVTFDPDAWEDRLDSVLRHWELNWKFERYRVHREEAARARQLEQRAHDRLARDL